MIGRYNTIFCVALDTNTNGDVIAWQKTVLVTALTDTIGTPSTKNKLNQLADLLWDCDGIANISRIHT